MFNLADGRFTTRCGLTRCRKAAIQDRKDGRKAPPAAPGRRVHPTVGVHAASHMLEPACARLSHGSGSTATRSRFTVPVAEKSSVPSSAKTSVRNGPVEVCPSLLM